MRVNVILLLFNLIPAFPMDGGRVLRALLAMRIGCQRATRAAARIGQVLALPMGLYGLFQGQPILVLIALFVFLGAGAEAAAVEQRVAGRGLTVRDMMMTRFQVDSGARPAGARGPTAAGRRPEGIPGGGQPGKARGAARRGTA